MKWPRIVRGESITHYVSIFRDSMSKFECLLSSYKIQKSSAWTSQDETNITLPYTYLLCNPGKDIRSTIIHAFNSGFTLNVPKDSLQTILKVVEMLHTASLLIDDVEDSSELRRGKKAAHLVFGAAQTINTANYIYFEALALLTRVEAERDSQLGALSKIFNEELLELHRGQGLELYWRDNLICPSEDEYIAMVNNKTGGLLRFAVRILMSESSHAAAHAAQQARQSSFSPEDLVPIANMVGILFQIRDDYMNIVNPSYSKEKGFCEDLTEGKFSFPVLHAVTHSPQGQRLLEILGMHTTSILLKKEAVQIMYDAKSLAYTRNTCNELDHVCRAEIDRLGGNPALVAILDKLKINDDLISAMT